jgi:hypothetical protein
VLKIRDVRELLRKYDVDESFTRCGVMSAVRDVDKTTCAVGFDAFKGLHIEYPQRGDLKPSNVFRYLLERRVFRVGLELTWPNCRFSSWIHLDEAKTRSFCGYCDHGRNITAQRSRLALSALGDLWVR